MPDTQANLSMLQNHILIHSMELLMHSNDKY